MFEEKNLALYLDAPLQSWGYGSKFDRRTSLSYPTRSGVLGMICAALGVDRTDIDGLRRLDGLSMTVLCFGGGARLVDFHTVGAGYDSKTEKQHIVRTADGKVSKTVVTRREFLQDARFGVVLGGDEELLDGIASALLDPRWGVWLGRKSCVPASLICQGFFDSEEAAEEHLRGIDAPKLSHTVNSHPRRYTEVATFDEGSDTIMDLPLDFATRRFAPRRVAEE